jgi:hypothetical protein
VFNEHWFTLGGTAVRLITVEQSEHLLPMADAIAILERAYRDLGEGRAVYRPRSDMVVPRSPGRDYWLSTMEGALLDPPVAAIRLRSDVYEEREVGGSAARPNGRIGLASFADWFCSTNSTPRNLWP